MIKVYKYGCLAPTVNKNVVDEQLSLANKYRNRLVEIERGRRSKVRAAISAYENVAELEATYSAQEIKINALIDQINQTRADAQTKKVAKEELDQLANEKTIQAANWKLLEAERKSAHKDPSVKEKTKLAEEESKAEITTARGASGLYWGTYQAIEEAHNAVRKMPLYDWVRPNDPQFKRWTGAGSVCFHFQNENVLNTTQIFKSNKNGYLEPVPEAAWQPGGTKLQRTKLYLRVQSGEKAKPIMAVFPCIMHRPLPDGEITWITVNKKMVGPRAIWTADITIRCEEPKLCSQTGQVAIHFGWRLVPNGMRVAYWVGSDGKSGELELTPWQISGFQKARDLQSIRDKEFDLAKKQLGTFLDGLAIIPEWMEKIVKKDGRRICGLWKFQGKLVYLINTWRDNRIEGDTAIYDIMDNWRKHDRHLWQWEAGQYQKALNNRKDYYRVFAQKMWKQYREVILSDTNYSQLAKTSKIEETKNVNETSRYNRMVACVSQLKDVIKNVFGSRVKIVSAKNITVSCHGCGTIESWKKDEVLHHCCSKCKLLWDQDDNARKNMLAAGCESPNDGQNSGASRDDKKANSSDTIKETRWARVARLKAEKETKLVGARKGVEKPSE